MCLPAICTTIASGKTESLEMITTGPVGRFRYGRIGNARSEARLLTVFRQFFDFAHLPNQLSHIFEKQ